MKKTILRKLKIETNFVTVSLNELICNVPIFVCFRIPPYSMQMNYIVIFVNSERFHPFNCCSIENQRHMSHSIAIASHIW